MPKYVFELGVTLAAGDDLTVPELNSINDQLCEYMKVLLPRFGKTRGRISAEAPFEHVVGDWLPPDENGAVRPKPGSRPIDWQPTPLEP
jgi:hypothetical protein